MSAHAHTLSKLLLSVSVIILPEWVCVASISESTPTLFVVYTPFTTGWAVPCIVSPKVFIPFIVWLPLVYTPFVTVAGTSSPALLATFPKEHVD